ncbi:phage terminase large subunit family protein [Anaerococcus degeneri]|uniref:Phage terminase large subunit family protein n=1 Tax=Anaerococcus degeneri TaxID=361500 RepID=A0ABS7YWG0_9FIRM|nr:phage terminase large subunit family protein [Anaerococcus degeneri]MBP2015715.1 phage terminase large subunit GpA-like protein [Anaerococcus degeneri]MCA2096077.1 phage terminase large subunit family protein [Anaerococcus degeneri]
MKKTQKKKKIKKNTFDLLCKIFAGLKPPPPITITEWADEYRRLSPEASAEPGRWKTSKAPYQKEIMDAIGEVGVEKVVVMSAAQIGKSDACILNPLGYYMHYDPSPIMILQPTIQMAEAFSKDRISPMLRDTPILQDKVDDKSRTSGNTILQKIFPGGHVTMVGANSPSSLASRPIRILLADEIDRYPVTAGTEGDPLLLATKRLTTFWNKKIVCVSTPTIKDLSRIEVEYDHSTQGEWNIPCPHCGEYNPLEWAYIKFDKEDLSEIEYTCRHCGAIASEYAWKSNFDKGKFIFKYPKRAVKGFHLNALASLFVSWAEIVEKFLVANEEKKKGNIELLKAWTNTEMGQTWEEEGEEIEMDELFNRLEEYGCEVPEDVIVLTAGVDVQDDRFEVEVVGWGEEKESWGIYYKKIYGDLKTETVWQDLDNFLGRTFETKDGRKLKILSTCIDSGGHFTQEVYKFAKKRINRRIWAIKGRGGSQTPYYSKPSTSNAYKTPLFTLGVDTGKAILYQRLAVEEPGPNYCHFPAEEGRGYTEEYFKGLTSEKMVISYKKGRAQYVWKVKKGIKRNEPLDIRNYATAALEITNPILKKEIPESTSKPQRNVRSRGLRQ